jgi:opacity protein-like surface antigen
MKALIVGTAALLVVSVTPTAAQQAPAPRLMRGDVAVSAAWLMVETRELQLRDHWHSEGLFGGGFGWYWTNHHKTEITAGASTETSTYGTVPLQIDNQQVFATSRYRFSSRRWAIAHHYQFGDNAWFHPFLGAGIEVRRDREIQREESVYVYDPVTRQSRLVRGISPERRSVESHARALIAGGAKSYVSSRFFVSTDLRLAVNRGVEDVVVRFGVGRDF